MEKNKELELIAGLKSLDSYNPEYKQRYSKKKDPEQEPEVETELTTEIAPETMEELPTEVMAEESPISDEVVIKVKVGGIEQELSLGELKNGYMMHSDYTKKTQDLAALRDEYAKGLKIASRAMEAFNDNSPNPALKQEEQRLAEILNSADWNKVSNTELVELMQVKARYESIKFENEKYLADIKAIRQAMKQENLLYRQRMQKEESERLLECIPEFADENNRNDVLDKIRNYLGNRIGKDKVDTILGNTLDHRDFLILRDAMIGNDYLTNKLPKKSVIKPTRRIGNDGIKDGASDTSKKTLADRTLRKVKARGDRAPATKEELMTILASKIS